MSENNTPISRNAPRLMIDGKQPRSIEGLTQIACDCYVVADNSMYFKIETTDRCFKEGNWHHINIRIKVKHANHRSENGGTACLWDIFKPSDCASPSAKQKRSAQPVAPKFTSPQAGGE